MGRRDLEYREKREEEDNDQITWFHIIFIVFCSLAALTVIEELWLLDSVVPFLLDIKIVEVFVELFVVGVAMLGSHNRIRVICEMPIKKPKKIARIIKMICVCIWEDTILCSLAILMILAYAPAAMANDHIVGRTAAFFQAGVSVDIEKGIQAFMDYSPEPNEDSYNGDRNSEEKNDEPEYSGEKEVHEDITDTVDGVKQSQNGKVQDEWIASHSVSEQEIAGSLRIAENEKNLVFCLSQEEYEELYFLSGGYQITNWSDDEHVKTQIKRKLVSLTEQKQENVFDKADGGAPPGVQNEVSQATKDERDKCELSITKNSIAVRNAAFSQYPKYSLVKLNSESYNGIGLAYYWQCRNEEMAGYYFSQAALELYKCLPFEGNSYDTQRNLVNSLRQRYADIEYVCTEECDEQFYSRKIKQALEKILEEM